MSRLLLLQIYLHWWGICPATWPARLSADSRTIGDQRVAQGWCGLASPRSGLAISSPCLTSTQSKAAYTNFAHCTCQFFPFANCYHDTHCLRSYRRYIIFTTLWHMLGQKSTFFQKFILWKSQFLKNSPFWNLIFHKIHVSRILIFTKFTFLKSKFSLNSHFWNIKIKEISGF